MSLPGSYAWHDALLAHRYLHDGSSLALLYLPDLGMMDGTLRTCCMKIWPRPAPAFRAATAATAAAAPATVLRGRRPDRIECTILRLSPRRARFLAVSAGVVAMLTGSALVRAATNLVLVTGPNTFAFNPSVLNITVGDTVLWTNGSTTDHDISEGTKATGVNSNNPYWSPIHLLIFTKAAVKFTNIGSYPYVCNQHVFVNPQPPGNPTQTGQVNVAAFNFPPTVDLTSPAAGTTLLEPATVTFTAAAADQDGFITNVQFFIGSNMVGEGAGSAASATIDGLPGGNYTLTAKAFDNLGATTVSAPVTLVVRYRVDYQNTFFSPPALMIKPGESILFTNLGGFHTVSGTGSEPFCGSALVSIPSCALTLNTVGTFPYQCAFHGSFGMTGAVSVASFNRPPLVSLISPAPNAVLTAPATVELKASAFDPDGTIAGVQFVRASSTATNITSDSTAPFSLLVSNLAAGTYTFTVRATDSGGLRRTSAPVSITVTAPLQLSAPSLGAGGFQFRYTASPGSKYVVEGSGTENGPAPFVPLVTNVAGSSLETFVDSAAVTRKNRAYRVFEQP